MSEKRFNFPMKDLMLECMVNDLIGSAMFYARVIIWKDKEFERIYETRIEQLVAEIDNYFAEIKSGAYS